MTNPLIKKWRLVADKLTEDQAAKVTLRKCSLELADYEADPYKEYLWDGSYFSDRHYVFKREVPIKAAYPNLCSKVEFYKLGQRQGFYGFYPLIDSSLYPEGIIRSTPEEVLEHYFGKAYPTIYVFYTPSKMFKWMSENAYIIT